MKSGNQNLKQRSIQFLDEFIELGFAITALLGNKTLYRENWQHSEPLFGQEIINDPIANKQYLERTAISHHASLEGAR